MKKPKVVVVGSINMDLVIQADTIPRKGQTILGQSFRQFPGGKGANQAVAAARMGADVAIIGCVGHDSYGEELIALLQVENINVDAVMKSNEVSTGIAQVTVADQDNSIIVVPGANHSITKEWIDQHIELIKTADILVMQLEIPLEIVTYAASCANRYHVPVILNPAPVQKLSAELLSDVTYLTPNETEFSFLSGGSDETGHSIDSLLSRLQGAVIITQGEKGVTYKEKASKSQTSLPASSVKVVDTTGAGDCFNGVLAAKLAQGDSLEQAIQCAITAAGISVTKHGAQTGMPRG